MNLRSWPPPPPHLPVGTGIPDPWLDLAQIPSKTQNFLAPYGANPQITILTLTDNRYVHLKMLSRSIDHWNFRALKFLWNKIVVVSTVGNGATKLKVIYFLEGCICQSTIVLRRKCISSALRKTINKHQRSAVLWMDGTEEWSDQIVLVSRREARRSWTFSEYHWRFSEGFSLSLCQFSLVQTFQSPKTKST